ncbi:hypothetical protein P4B35_16080 [Pontiellaceae bacterium B12227]|nr:hypothetical protein [Pontiellaceae bacterium B12227]
MKNRNITTFALGAGLMLAASVQAVTYDFSLASGYTNGVLSGQNGWTGNDGNTVAGEKVAISSNQWQSSYAPDLIDAATDNIYTLSAVFSFDETNPTNGGNDVFSFQFSGGPRIYLSRSGATGYALSMKDTENTPYGWKPFNESVLGLSSNDLTGEACLYTCSLSKGHFTNSWSATFSLSNLTSGVTVETSASAIKTTESFFTNSTIKVGISSSRNEDTTKTTNRVIDDFSVTSSYVALIPLPGPTVVQWGEPGGDTAIVTNNQNFALSLGSYVAGSECNPAIGDSYYSSAVDRTPIFNQVASATANTKRVLEGGSDGDSIESAKNQKEYRMMLAWENFMLDNHTLDYLATSTRRSKSLGDDYSDFRWVIEKGTGDWYASAPVATTGGWELYEENYPDSIDWYAFNPYQDIDSVTFASNATFITMDDIVTVGSFNVFTNSSGGWNSHQTRYFKASATPGPVSTKIVQWGAAGGSTDITTNDVGVSGESSTYVAGTESNPTVGPDYYPNNTDKSPVFNFAGYAAGSVQSLTIDDDWTGDRIQVNRNQTNQQHMVVWENYLDETATTLMGVSIEIQGFNAAFSDGNYRIVIEKSNGDWFASEATALTTAYTDGIIQYTDGMTWYEYTPHAGDNPVIAATPTTIDMENVVSVGYYAEVNGASSAWYGTRMRHFAAYAAPAGASGYEEWATEKGVGGMGENPDNDALDNWGEYIFGGEPLDGDHVGTQPVFDASTGDYVFWTLGAEDGLKARVLTTDSLTTGTWATGAVINVSSGSISGDFLENSETIGTADAKKFIKLIVE